MALLRRTGDLTLLRAHERGSGFGPDDDFIDVEVVGKISSEPDHAFGLEMRDNDELPAHEAMFALLRDGLRDDLDVTVEYDIDEDRQNGLLLRVELRP